MTRPTVADLATASGVSASTINRLLHGRQAVRPETAERILDAANAIGFYGLGALQLRKKENLPARRLGFLMQQSRRSLYRTWAEALAEASRARADYSAIPDIMFEDDLAAEAVAANLLALGNRNDAVALVSADHPLISQAVEQLSHKGIPVVAYVSDLSASKRAGFVGTDSWKLGRTAAWFTRRMSATPGKVYPLIGSNRYQSQDIADASFRSYMREHAPHLQVQEALLTHEEPERALAIASELFENEDGLAGIFMNGGGISGVVQALRSLSPERQQKICVVCRDYGPEGQKGLSEGLIAAALRLPADIMSEALIDVMLRLIERKSSPAIEQRLIPFEVVTPESLWT